MTTRPMQIVFLLVLLVVQAAQAGQIAPSPLSADPGYPRRVTDLAGRDVVLSQAPRRIYLANGNHLMVLALLDRENPLQRLAGWNDGIRASDPSLWRGLQDRWPETAQVPVLNLNGDINAGIEQLLALRPDLLVFNVEKQAEIESGPLASVARRLALPILYVDTSRDAVEHAPKTVAVLGRALGQETRADAFVQDYGRRLARIRQGLAGTAVRPRVFIEARAGRMGLDQCCYTQGDTTWGRLIEAAGGRNLGSELLRGRTGEVPIERLIHDKPEVYLMTGTPQNRKGSRLIPFGYGAEPDTTRTALQALMARQGLSWAANAPQACVYAVTHQFYDTPLNIVAVEFLAKVIHPALFPEIDADRSYRELVERYTHLPDTPFVFNAALRWDGARCEE